MKLPTVECEVCGKKGLLRVADSKKIGLCKWGVTFSLPIGWCSQSFGKKQRQRFAPVINLWCSMECLCKWGDDYATKVKRSQVNISVGV